MMPKRADAFGRAVASTAMNAKATSRGPGLWHAAMLLGIGVVFSLALAISGYRAGAFQRWLRGEGVGTAPIAIEIDPGPPVRVAPEHVRLAAPAGEVVWQCRGGCAFSVDFVVAGPFQQSHFDQGQPYGKWLRNVKRGESFAYTLTVGAQTTEQRLGFE